MATIKEIATLARVSTATVSHVLNRTAFVSGELRARVMQVVRELNYQPDIVARSLRTRRSQTIGMVVPNIANPFFPIEVRGVEDVLRHDGYHLIVGNSDNDLHREEEYYRTFCARRVDGLVLAITPRKAPEYLRRHDGQETPVVLIDRAYDEVSADAVTVDNLDASYRAVCHLIERGHRRIGIVTGPPRMLMAGRRLCGYKRALEQQGIPVLPELIREGRYDALSGYQEAKVLLNLVPRPSALFACSGVTAMGCLRALFESGLKCPGDVALVSFDDLEWFDLGFPRITAVANPAYQLGSQAAELLVKRISGELSGPAVRKILKAELKVRDSTAARVGASAGGSSNGSRKSAAA
ncbi:MAG: LacI family DNA-binding transcriptional regulator [Terriglobia bacterium]